MKRRILFILLFLPFVSNAQCSKREPGFAAYVYSGIFFKNLTAQDNKPDSQLSFCDSSERVFFLDSLKLSLKAYLNLHLGRKELNENNAKFTYKYSDPKNTCIEAILLYVDTKIKIKLNNVLLTDKDEKEKALSKIHESDLLSIQYHSPFLGSIAKKGFIEIITMTK